MVGVFPVGLVWVMVGGIAGLNPRKQTTYIISLTIGTDVITCAGHVGAVPCLGTDAKPPLRRSSKSFRPLHLRVLLARRIRSYANRPILHYFGANKSFRFRSYRHPARNPFRIRSYKNTLGVAPPLSHALPSPDLHESLVTSHKSRQFITTFRINTCIGGDYG